jgi:glycosyltransferase involved in cell wall biosynthesis
LGWGCSGYILLSKSSLEYAPATLAARIKSKPNTIILHGHYITAYGPPIEPIEARRSIGLREKNIIFGFVGRLAPYKGIEELIIKFSETALGSQMLVVAGAPESSEYAAHLSVLAAKDTRILLKVGFLSGEELRSYVCAFDYLVLPFKKITNTGSAVLGFSYGVPVIVPELPLFTEWRGIVGTDGCLVYTNLDFSRWKTPLPPAIRTKASEGMRAFLDWEKIALETERFFRSVSK